MVSSLLEYNKSQQLKTISTKIEIFSKQPNNDL